MQASLKTADSQFVSYDGRYTARLLTQPNGWMTGTIDGGQASGTEREALVQAVFASIEAVAEDERAYSTCTDGRKRMELESGTAVPVREQLVGTDTMCAFVAAEALGAHFYGDELYAPVEKRIAKVIDHLLAHGYRPTAHIACGAAGGFTTVMNRATQFIKDPAYVERMQALLGDTYNDTLHHLIVGSYQSRLVSGVYEGYRDGLVAEIVLDKVGPEAIEYYNDDGQGVHGHREKMVVYLDAGLQGLAVNPNAMIEKANAQVFGVNSGRADALAHAVSGEDSTSSVNYLTARIAIEDFACAGHGTLAANMETLVVSRNA